MPSLARGKAKDMFSWVENKVDGKYMRENE